ncbi:RDD family protein [Kibdelosporangium philippinense]|uniref:RDD family protein n=1 Tax=Kibdelosporangium philippinense TaxID=211113 RepID=A0ABS8ZHH7_9PSEU|nr:RDD family protein [Kibdelosporangium philippinense]MCE7007276.1 RDD family protein [Kibdelosporangium philippinense]
MSDLVSGEAVLLEVRVAKLASRGLAIALDVLIQAAALLFLAMILSAAGLVGFDNALQGTVTLVGLVAVLVGYPVTAETLTRGKTVGKAAAGLRVVRVDGGPIRFRHALVRGLAGFFVDFWGVGLLGAVAVIVSLSSRNSQRVGDMLAGTLVIRERIPEQNVAPVYMPPPLANWASTQNVTGLPNDLALAIRQYLGRLHELAPEAAHNLGSRLAAEVSAYLGSPVPPNVPVYAYLSAILAERRTREQARHYQQNHRPQDPQQQQFQQQPRFQYEPATDSQPGASSQSATDSPWQRQPAIDQQQQAQPAADSPSQPQPATDSPSVPDNPFTPPS